MVLMQGREYVTLLIGDLCIFFVALWLTLVARSFAVPPLWYFQLHLAPFSILFVVWIGVFFLAGLYGKHTRMFRSKLTNTILWTQAVNIAIAAIFFFFVPVFGIAPKTNLLLYLLISSPLIFIWRALVFPRMRPSKKQRGVLIASGPDAKALAEEVNQDERFPFSFGDIVDTKSMAQHEVIQRACRVAEDDSVMLVAVDFTDPAIVPAMPILYDAAFQKRRFVLVGAIDLFQEIFDRVPLSLTRYEWVLGSLSTSRVYDGLKRILDVLGGLILGAVSLIFYPFVMLAIKLDDGGSIFITQERVGRFEQPIKVMKFRTMSGNDHGQYGESGKTKLTVTRVGRFLRVSRVDEFPQFWNVLKGDLSLVGPRPELPALSAQYSARIPYYNARYLVAPGLMGWAQLKHDRHPHHGTDIVETKEKLSYDLYYLSRRSLLLDIYIILQTIRVVLTARGS